MAEGSRFSDRFSYALANAPRGGDALGSFLGPLTFAMGMPSMLPGNDLNTYFFDQALRRGQNPMEVLPWLNGSASSATKPPADPDAKKYKGLAPWYVDWLKTSGNYGGVPPVQGLL